MKIPFPTACSMILSSTLVFSACSITSSGNDVVMDKIHKNNEIIIGTSFAQAPFTVKEANGETSGIDIEVAQRIASGMGVNLTFKGMSFNKLLGALQQGEIDIVLSGMTITEQRNKNVLFAGPYFRSFQAYASVSGDFPDDAPLQDVITANTRVGVLQGSTHELALLSLPEQPQIVYGTSYKKLFEKLSQNEIDLMVGEYVGIASVDTEINATIVKNSSYEPIGAAIRTGNYHLLNWLDKFFSKLVNNNETDKIFSDWLDKHGWEE